MNKLVALNLYFRLGQKTHAREAGRSTSTTRLGQRWYNLHLSPRCIDSRLATLTQTGGASLHTEPSDRAQPNEYIRWYSTSIWQRYTYICNCDLQVVHISNCTSLPHRRTLGIRPWSQSSRFTQCTLQPTQCTPSLDSVLPNFELN